MIRFAGIFFLGSLISFTLFAQEPNSSYSREDSLLSVLKKTGNDSNRVKTLLQLANLYRAKDIKKGFERANEALVLARQLKYHKGQANALRSIGNLYQLEGSYAIELSYYLEALPIYEKLGDSTGISDCYNSIGNLYTNIDNFEKALEYHTLALEMRRKINNERGVASSLNNIGNIFLSQKKSREALKYYEEALAINERQQNSSWKANNLSNIGIAYQDLKEFEKSIAYHNQALNIRKELGNELQVAGSKIYLGFTYLRKGEPRRAYEYFMEGMSVPNGPLKLLEQGHQGLAEYWEITGNYQKSLEHYKTYIRIRDSLSGKGTSVAVAESVTRFETIRKEREAEQEREIFRLQQEAELSAQKFITWVFVAGALFLLLLSGFFWYRFTEKRKSEKVLEEKVAERTAQLQEANQELSKFIYQSSHDMRSPLTSIKGLLDIAKSEVPKGDPLRYLNLMANRVEHLDGVYLSLVDFMNVKDREVKPESIELAPFVNELIEKVNERRADHCVRFINSIPPGTIVNADKFLLSIVLKNIFINAVDFCDVMKNPFAEITSAATASGFEIRVKDNGTGIAASYLPSIFKMFNRGSNTSRGSGLGLYTAKTAAEKIGANLEVSSRVGLGSTFTILLKPTLEIPRR